MTADDSKYRLGVPSLPLNCAGNISGKIIDSRKAAFPGEVISDFLQENKNFFPKLENFANTIFEKVKQNNRTRYIALCDFLKTPS